ncbi:hypothetical protein STHU_40900 [Allostella humosa]|nr:hypothetical protein STHU_40900 [Stella humosa]
MAPRNEARVRRGSQIGQAPRLLALSAICDGGSRGDAARLGGVRLQTVRDWVLAFNADGSDGLIDRKGGGPSSKLSAEQWVEAANMVEASPTPAPMPCS